MEAVRIFDVFGRLVLTAGRVSVVDVSGLAAGDYFVKSHRLRGAGRGRFRWYGNIYILEVTTSIDDFVGRHSHQQFAQDEKEAKGFLMRYFEGVFGPEQDSTASKFIHYPTLAYAPETSWEFGVSSLYVYSANRNPANRLSEVKSFAFFTLENQYGLWLDHALYSDANKWFMYGKARYQSFPLFYYGIGRDSPAAIQSVIDGEYLLIRERIMRETWPSLYCGLELDYQRLSGIEYQHSRGLSAT